MLYRLEKFGKAVLLVSITLAVWGSFLCNPKICPDMQVFLAVMAVTFIASVLAVFEPHSA